MRKNLPYYTNHSHQEKITGLTSEQYYEATQQQRVIERRIRKYKRDAAALEEVGLNNAKQLQRIKEQQAAQRKHVADNSLRRDYERERAWGVGGTQHKGSAGYKAAHADNNSEANKLKAKTDEAKFDDPSYRYGRKGLASSKAVQQPEAQSTPLRKHASKLSKKENTPTQNGISKTPKRSNTKKQPVNTKKIREEVRAKLAPLLESGLVKPGDVIEFTKDSFPELFEIFELLPFELNKHDQFKHSANNPEYNNKEKSLVYLNDDEIVNLVEMHAFSSPIIAYIKDDTVQFKQEIKHNKITGENVFDIDKEPEKTQWLTIHYGSKGFHVVTLFKKEWL